MEHRTTRPQAALRACRIRRLVVVALSVLAWLSLAPVLAQTGSGSMTRRRPSGQMAASARRGSLVTRTGSRAWRRT